MESNIILENPQTLQFTSECIKSTDQFLQSVYHNICTGTTNVVPLGFWDLILNITVGLVPLALVGIIGALVLTVMRY